MYLCVFANLVIAYQLRRCQVYTIWQNRTECLGMTTLAIMKFYVLISSQPSDLYFLYEVSNISVPKLPWKYEIDMEYGNNKQSQFISSQKEDTSAWISFITVKCLTKRKENFHVSEKIVSMLSVFLSIANDLTSVMKFRHWWTKEFGLSNKVTEWRVSIDSLKTIPKRVLLFIVNRQPLFP